MNLIQWIFPNMCVPSNTILIVKINDGVSEFTQHHGFYLATLNKVSEWRDWEMVLGIYLDVGHKIGCFPRIRRPVALTESWSAVWTKCVTGVNSGTHNVLTLTRCWGEGRHLSTVEVTQDKKKMVLRLDKDCYLCV